jgi:hypothetical protein
LFLIGALRHRTLNTPDVPQEHIRQSLQPANGIGDTRSHRLIAQAFAGRLLTVMARLTRFKSVAKSENGRRSSGQHAISAG